MDLRSIIDRLEDKDDETFKESCLKISEGINASQITILDLIESLSSFLTSGNVSKRELGTAILTHVLNNIPINSLNTLQLGALAGFFSDKLKDHHQVLPVALSGILTLIQFENFPGDKISVVLNSIFQNVPCQQQQRADRYTIFQIFDVALKIFKQEIEDMKMEFVYGVLQSIDGERDPRNLLYLFKWMKIFFSQCSLQHLTEDMFDVLACYFPVDFRAPQSEKAISRKTLAEALSPCLCAVPEFGDSCVSLALEKLDSSLEIAKTDSLKLLKEGCATFETSVYLDKSAEIWSLIQKEILRTNSDQIRLECLETLSTVISKICEDEKGFYLTTLEDITDTLKGNLLPDSKFFERSAQILVYTASGSKTSCRYVIREVIPILTNIYNMTAYTDQRSLIVTTLTEFVKVHLKYYKTLEVEDVPELTKIPLLCLELLKLQGKARIIGFNGLMILTPYLMTEVRQKLYVNIQHSILMPDDIEDKNSFVNCLKTVASYFPDEVKSQVFSKITTQVSVLDPLLKSMSALINLKEFRNYTTDKFLNYIKNPEFSKVAINNLKYLLEQEHKNHGLLQELMDKNILNTLIEVVFKNNYTEIGVLQDTSAILKFLIAQQKTDVQNEIIRKYFDPILQKIEECNLHLLILYGLLSPVRRDVPITLNTLYTCYDLSVGSENEVVRGIAVQLLANLINKAIDDENLLEFLKTINERCATAVMFSSKNILIVSCWVTKALLMKNHAYAIKWLDWLLQLIELYPELAVCLKIIMKDDYDSLSMDLYCQKSLLYRQKAFIYITNRICEKYDQNKPSYLMALAYLLEFTPQKVVLLQFPKICKFVVLCLEKIRGPEAINIVLSVIKNVINSDSALLETHLEDFLTRILTLTGFKGCMKIRILSLKCLVMFTTSYPVYKLLPFRSKVLYQLRICVDDKKRLVRREAMEARSLWFLLDAPM